MKQVDYTAELGPDLIYVMEYTVSNECLTKVLV